MSGFVLDRGLPQPLLCAGSLEEQVREALRYVLLTRRGERVLQPELGCDLHRFFFRPLSENLLEEMRKEVAQAIDRSEPRVKVLEVKVKAAEEAPENLELNVRFEYIRTRKTGQVKVQVHA